MASVCGRCRGRAKDCSPAVLLAAPSAAQCPACLGLLHLERLVESITLAVQTARYEFTDFLLELALPNALQLREAWFQHHLPGALEIKEALRWLLIPALERTLGKPSKPASLFVIRVTASCAEAEADLALLRFPGKRRQELSTKAVALAIEQLGAAVLASYMPVAYTADVRTEVSHEPVYLGGSYLKLSRRVSQSPWLIEGEDQPTLSVQELVGKPLQEAFACASCLLHGSVRFIQGREDVDVRMLGSGRPFVVTLLDPHMVLSAVDAGTLETRINSSTTLIQVRGLKLVPKQFFEELKASEEDKLKVYSAVVWSSRALTSSDLEQLNSQPSIDLQQKTPVRVLHRRSQLTRIRSILALRARQLTPHLCEVRLVSTAGTYIKEFVHGDLGRTQPNLGSLLGCRTDILQLDVLGLGWSLEELQTLLEG